MRKNEATKLEIERKFIVKELPFDYKELPKTKIKQGYIFNLPEQELRLRKANKDYLLTIKQGRGIRRVETEIKLSNFQFNKLWKLTKNQRVKKSRYQLKNKENFIEIDIYKKDLSGLITAEVEFQSLKASRAFIPPKWFATEITEDDNFKNKNLASLSSKDFMKIYLEKYGNRAKIYNEAGVLPYKIEKNGNLKFMFITTRKGKKWSVPKGLIEKHLDAKTTAAKEAMEEAGIEGEIADEKLGDFHFGKWGGICKVSVYPMRITHTREVWEEMYERNRKWFNLKEALKRIKNQELEEIIKKFFEEGKWQNW